MNGTSHPNEIDRLPVLVLFPHSRCNCRCLMCDIWKIREEREITATEMEARIPEFSRLGVKHVVFSGGEPLMHSGLEGLARPLRAAGIRVTLLSSGISLEAAAARMREIADDVIVSLDGPQPVHDAIRRVPGAYSKLALGVAAVKRACGTNFRVTARTTVQKSNAFHIGETVTAAHDLGLDGISFLAVDVDTSAFNRPDTANSPPRGNGLTIPAAELARFASSLEELFLTRAEDFQTGFIAESPEKLWRNLYLYFESQAGTGEFPGGACNAPWVSAVIESDGTVRPCFFHAAYGKLEEGSSLQALLNSREAVEFRQRLDVATDPVCRRCVCRLNLKPSDLET